MARQLTTIKQIDAYINKIVKNANHHASGVATVIISLSDEVKSRLNLAQDFVEVYQRLGQMGRPCWVTFDGRRYAFSYKHKTQKIELRSNTRRGKLISQFDNQTSLATIQAIVLSL